MLTSIPLLVVSFILYNLGLAGLFGDGPNGDPWQTELFSFRMMSGGTFSMTLGILMIVIALLLFFIALAVFAPLIVDEDGLDLTKATGAVLQHPTREYWLGTDDSGRPILTQLIFGSRVSLFIGMFATLISMVIGTVIGLLSGFLEGWGAKILFRLTEWFLVLPFLPLVN